MIKLNLLLILILYVFNINAQSKMLIPSKYESDKYDYVYKWDTIQKPTEQEILVLKEYQTSLLSNLYRLRLANKTRWYLECLPDEIQELRYVKSHLVKDGTVPIFKLILDTNVKQSNEKRDINKLANQKTLKQLIDKGITTSDSLPKEFKEYVNDFKLSVPVTASQYYEDPYDKLDTLEYCSKKWLSYFLKEGYDCYSIEQLNSMKLILASDKNEIQQYEETRAIFKSKLVTFRFFVNKEGQVKYIDCTNNNIGDKCFKHMTTDWTSLIINNYDFLPAIKNGNAINSYTEISIFLSGSCSDTPNNKTKRK